MKIILQFHELQQASNNLLRQRDIFNQSITDMQATLNQLQSSWEGKAANAYQEQFNQLKPSFNKTLNLIERISYQIKDIMEDMQAHDLAIASKLGGIE